MIPNMRHCCMPLSEFRFIEIQNAARKDAELQELVTFIRNAFPKDIKFPKYLQK